MTKVRGFEVVKNEARKTEGNVTLPKRSTSGSAGYDFYLPYDVTIKPHSCSGIIPTDVKAYMQEGEVLLLYVRSSVGIKKGLVLANGTGVIDKDYYSNLDNDGNIGICLRNIGDQTVSFNEGDRIAQGIIERYYIISNDAPVNEVRNAGFGSTGK